MAKPPRSGDAASGTPASAPATPDVDFQAVVESMPDVVYVLDLDGRFAYLNPRAYEVFGYDRATDEDFIGRPVIDLVAPGAGAAAMGAIRHRAETPHDRHVFRVDGRHKNGTPIPLEIHGGPVWRDGRVVGRVGICRVLDETEREDGAMPSPKPHMVYEERMRIARGLRDAIAQIVFGVTAERDASESFLVDVKRATRLDLARRLQLDDVDQAILRLIAAGASNREIGSDVHLSPAAVKDRVRRLMDRLGARRRAELAAHALRLGFA